MQEKEEIIWKLQIYFAYLGIPNLIWEFQITLHGRDNRLENSDIR
jgi:hypothetical protein